MRHMLLTIVLLLAAVIPVRATGPVIGIISPETGRLSYLGADIAQAVELAVDELNSSGGLLGESITVRHYDNKSELEDNILVTRQAVRDKVDCVIGPLVSSRALAAAKILQEAGIPMISPGASAAGVTLQGDYIFRSNFTNDFQGRIMAHFSSRQLKAKTAAIMTQVDETYSTTLTNAFGQAFRQSGGTVVYRGQYKASQTDFLEDIKEIQAASPDVLIIPGYDIEAARIIMLVRKQGLALPIVGGDAWSANISKLISNPNYLDGCYEIRHFSPTIATDAARIFMANYEERYGAMKHDVGALAYDAVLVYAAAVREAGTFSRAAVRNAISNINVKGITGTIRFDKNGDPKKPAQIVTYRDGTAVYFMVMEP